MGYFLDRRQLHEAHLKKRSKVVRLFRVSVDVTLILTRC